MDATFGSGTALLGFAEAANGYLAVYSLEIVLLLITIAATLPLIRRERLSTRVTGTPAVDPGSGSAA